MIAWVILVIILLIYTYTPRRVCGNPVVNILIGIPVIDRDIDIADKVYEHIINSIKNTKGVNYTLLIATRESDVKSIRYWKDKGELLIQDNYEIKGRHNFDGISKTFNEIKDRAVGYDALIIVESDILVNKTTFSDMLNKIRYYHCVCSYFETPWCKYPCVIIGGLYHRKVDGRVYNNRVILGHGTGCVMIRTEVFNDCNFDHKSYMGIKGQDVGFFKSMYDNNYTVFLLDDEVEHLYNR